MVAWTRRFGTWLWKEWRDHRAVTVGILLAIPALTALAFLAFGEHLAGMRLAATRAVFLAIAVGLVNFAVAASLFAGETRRGTLRAVRRLPRALGTAFAAKGTFLVLLVVVVVGWQGICLAIAEGGNRGTGVELGLREGLDGGPLRALALWDELGAFPTSALWLTGLGFGVVCLWTLLVSTWLGRSGVAGVGAFVLLALVGTPFFLFFLAHPWFFPGPLVLAGWTAGIAALVALLAACASFLHGARFDGRPLRPFLAGAAVLMVAVGGGYAYAHVALEHWLDVDPDDEDFRIYEAHVGAGAHHLFLTVHRGDAWVGEANLSAREHAQWTGRRGTPFQAWVMDLRTGALRKFVGGEGRYFMPVPELEVLGFPGSVEPPPALVQNELGTDRMATAVAWWDAVAGEPRRTLPPRVRDAVSLDLVRRTLSACAWQRDAKGRRVWLRDGIVEREGDPLAVPVGLVPRPERERFLFAVPGGWYGWLRTPGSTQPPKVFVDVDTGAERVVAPDYLVSSYGHEVISPDHWYGWLQARDRPKGSEPTRALVPLAGGPARAPVNPPEATGSVIARDRVLALRGPETGRTLHVWDPVTGLDEAVAWEGPAPQGLAAAAVQGRAGDGRMVLALWSGDGSRKGWAVLSADGRRAWFVGDWQEGGRARPIALLPDDTLVMVEDLRRVVCHAPGRAPEVWFPR